MAFKISKDDLTRDVRALLDSTKDGLSQRDIERDYREYCGGKPLDLRTRQLGFPSALAFLRELAEQGNIRSNGQLYFAGNPDAKTAHIQELVRKQQDPKARRNRPRRGHSSASPPQNIPPRNPVVTKNLPIPVRDNVIRMLKEAGGSLPFASFLSSYQKKYRAEFNFRQFRFNSLREALISIYVIDIKEDEHKQTVLQLAGSRQAVPSAPSPTMASSSSRIPEAEMKDNIRKLLKAGPPSGVYLTKISSEYKKLIGRTLDPHSYGWSTLLELLNDMSDICDLDRENELGDWVVSIHKARPRAKTAARSESDSPPHKIPKGLHNEIIQLVSAQPHGIYLAHFLNTFKLHTQKTLPVDELGYADVSTLLKDLDDPCIKIVNGQYGSMVKKVDLSHSLEEDFQQRPQMIGMPTDFAGAGYYYTLPSLPAFGVPIYIRVSHIYDPAHFYIQIMKSINTGNALEELMDNLDRVYSQLESKPEAKLPDELVQEQQTCVTRYQVDNNWHRAKITELFDETWVRVQFVDYGTHSTVPRSKLYMLRKHFMVMPALAIQSSLYGIRSKEEKWPKNAAKELLSLTSNQVMEASVRSLSKDNLSVEISIQGSLVGVSMDVATYLVSNRLAESTIGTHQGQTKAADFEKLDHMIDWGVDSSSDEEDEPGQPIREKVSPPPSTLETVLETPEEITSSSPIRNHALLSSPSKVSEMPIQPEKRVSTPPRLADQPTKLSISLSNLPNLVTKPIETQAPASPPIFKNQPVTFKQPSTPPRLSEQLARTVEPPIGPPKLSDSLTKSYEARTPHQQFNQSPKASPQINDNQRMVNSAPQQNNLCNPLFVNVNRTQYQVTQHANYPNIHHRQPVPHYAVPGNRIPNVPAPIINQPPQNVYGYPIPQRPHFGQNSQRLTGFFSTNSYMRQPMTRPPIQQPNQFSQPEHDTYKAPSSQMAAMSSPSIRTAAQGIKGSSKNTTLMITIKNDLAVNKPEKSQTMTGHGQATNSLEPPSTKPDASTTVTDTKILMEQRDKTMMDLAELHLKRKRLERRQASEANLSGCESSSDEESESLDSLTDEIEKLTVSLVALQKNLAAVSNHSGRTMSGVVPSMEIKGKPAGRGRLMKFLSKVINERSQSTT